MTLRHMKIFVAVFQHSNITRAAAELHLAQPSVSFAIKELEEYYGIQLFERIGRRIYPSQSGKEFYSYALHIVSLFDNMETKIKNWDTLGSLRIGTSITIGTHILPVLLKKYQLQYPSLTVQAIVSKSSDIEHKILDNSIDIGLIETNPGHDEICSFAFMQDTMCAIVPCNHPLADHETVTLSQLTEYPFLMREKGSAGRELLDACFALGQLSVQPLLESSSTQAIVKAVSEGLGVAILPYLLVERDIHENAVTMLRLHQPLKRELNIIYHRDKYLTPNMNAFIALCKKYGAECAFASV
ncbi:MAG TPA: LysR family transcriptional regulator [Firmicutes bacterium]|nr:LysR family transcriptional regulator [Bacillota bacterium]